MSFNLSDSVNKLTESVKVVGDSAAAAGNTVLEAGKQAGEFVGRCVIPENKTIAAGAAAIGCYASNVSLTFVPNVVNGMCVKGVCGLWGSNLAARSFAQLVIVPLVGPALTPVAATAAGIGAGLLVTATGNRVYYYLYPKEVAVSENEASESNEEVDSEEETSEQKEEVTSENEASTKSLICDATGELHEKTE